MQSERRYEDIRVGAQRICVTLLLRDLVSIDALTDRSISGSTIPQNSGFSSP